jgi:hypothetical protein
VLSSSKPLQRKSAHEGDKITFSIDFLVIWPIKKENKASMTFKDANMYKYFFASAALLHHGTVLRGFY